MVHVDALDPVFWPTPEEELAEHNRGKQQPVDNTMAATVSVGAMSPVVAATKLGEATLVVGLATTTTRARLAAVMEVVGARRVLVVAEDAAKGATRVATTGAVNASLGEAPKNGRTAREAVERGMARPPPPARLLSRARTAAMRPW